jgi:hypothetical protein
MGPALLGWMFLLAVILMVYAVAFCESIFVSTLFLAVSVYFILLAALIAMRSAGILPSD